MGKGAEDTDEWNGKVENEFQSVMHCRNCDRKIGTWHCANSGCPWCKYCGDKLKEKK